MLKIVMNLELKEDLLGKDCIKEEIKQKIL